MTFNYHSRSGIGGQVFITLHQMTLAVCIYTARVIWFVHLTGAVHPLDFCLALLTKFSMSLAKVPRTFSLELHPTVGVLGIEEPNVKKPK